MGPKVLGHAMVKPSKESSFVGLRVRRSAELSI